MKKKIYVLCILLVFGLIVLYSCKKEDFNQTKTELQSTSQSSFTNIKYPMNTRLAQRYYDKLKSEEGNEVNYSALKTKQTKETNKKYLVWKKAYEGKTDSSTFVEVPIIYNRRPSSIVVPQGEAVNAENTRKLLNGSFDRLLIIKNMYSGKVAEFIVNYLPDLEYLRKHNNDVNHNQFGKIDKDFSGYIKYKDWEGKTISLYRIEQGKFIGKFIKYGYNKQPKSTVESAWVCTQPVLRCEREWAQDCFTYENGESFEEVCSQWYLISENCYDYCLQWEDDNTDPQPGNEEPPACVYWSEETATTLLNAITAQVTTTQTFNGSAESAPDASGKITKPVAINGIGVTLHYWGSYYPHWNTQYTGVVYRTTSTSTWKWDSFSFNGVAFTSGDMAPCMSGEVSTNIATTISGDKLKGLATGSYSVTPICVCLFGQKTGSPHTVQLAQYDEFIAQ